MKRSYLLLFSLFIAVPSMGQRVALVSVDGLASGAIASTTAAELPSFYRLMAEGASTLNARNDYDYTITLPNHVTMVTGRGVVGTDGHNWTINTDPTAGQTIHTNKGSYVSSIFDVVAAGARTSAVYASKTKFSLFDASYSPEKYHYDAETTTLVDAFLAEHPAYDFIFLHLYDPDNVGHAYGWESSEYAAAVRKMDTLVGRVLDAVDATTTVIVTSDHGGSGYGHSDASNAANYTIPFFVWGPGVTAGADLYALNLGARQNPGDGRPAYSDPLQPIRNGDAANLAASRLGLSPVPGSTIGTTPLVVDGAMPEATSIHVALVTLSTESLAKGQKRGVATVVVEDNFGRVVSDASVTGKFVGTFTGESTASTTDGAARFTSDNAAKGGVTFDFCVTGVTGSLPHDATLDTYVCDPNAGSGDGGGKPPKDNNGKGNKTEIELVDAFSSMAELPAELVLRQNYPNPFNPETAITFGVPEGMRVTVSVWDVLGRQVALVSDGYHEPGYHTVRFSAGDLPSGNYLYRIDTDRGALTGTMMLLR